MRYRWLSWNEKEGSVLEEKTFTMHAYQGSKLAEARAPLNTPE